MHKIFKCLNCDNYTLKLSCPKCGLKTIDTKPAKFKWEDKYSKYRLEYKKELENAVDL
ncbi:MAG: nucleolar RNA-binding Nop10p family protein [Candidatus Nanoarchaeia archaeon]|nr:nucleolar RNA-binding Nop10p family protein [Candidatus Nanoarchaeia archaeon]